MASFGRQITIYLIFVFVSVIWAQKVPNFAEGRTTIVHLFEWKWSDIAQECEGFLRDKGFGGVQISPPNENLEIVDRPWWERYQPVSYILTTRSGDEAAFVDMVSRCNAAGVRIYVDTVINHMSALNGSGTAGSIADRSGKNYPSVPYGVNDFHWSCDIFNYSDPGNVRNCELDKLADLNQGTEYVKEKIVEYMNRLVDLGVAGFRVDAAKHMWPEDLREIYSRLNNLNTEHGFQENSRPFIFQEVIDLGGGGEAISKHEYTDFGTVIEFVYGATLGSIFQHGNKLSALESWGSSDWNLLNGLDAVAFIDNHDNQRTGGSGILTYKNAKPYKMAIGFMQAHPYGVTRIMSSYAFDYHDQGPPHDSEDNILSPTYNDDLTCGNGYVCEHRWRQIYNMVGFRNAVGASPVQEWWTNYDDQIAFSRGDKGFVAFTQEGDINQTIHTSLPAGTYCDIISGNLLDGECTGKVITVGEDGNAQILLSTNEEDGLLAIHVNAKL